MRHFYYTLQTLLHARGSQLIKIITLSLGLMMSVFLFARLAFELSFDSFWHEPDCLYLIRTGWLKDGVLQGSEASYTIQAIPGTITEEFPDEVKSATTSCSLYAPNYRLGDRKLELPTVMADTLYFATLGLDVLEGNPQELANPDVIFLSRTAARTIFGSESPLGKTLTYNFWGTDVPMLVKGIFADVPLNTALDVRPESIISFPSIVHNEPGTRMGWNSGGNYEGFLRLFRPQDADVLNERLSAAIARHIPEESGLELSVRITPFRHIHLSQPKVQKMIWIMVLLGAVLLFTTALNYVLISVASLTRRAKAIGVHKCSGASGGNIFSMFMVETAVVLVLSLALIGILVYVFREKMEELAAVPLSVLFTWGNLWAPLAVVVLLFLLGGCLPGLLFSRIPVTQVFRRYTSGRRGWKRVLLFVQFAGAAFILGMLLVVFSQYSHVTGRDRGFRPERVAYVYQRSANPENLRSFLGGLPYVESMASAGGNMMGFGAAKLVTDNQGGNGFYPRNTTFDKDFVPFIGLRLREGHNLTGNDQLLVNRKFVEKMQWTDGALGKRVNDYGTVVGVFDTFSFMASPDDQEAVMVEWQKGTARCLHVRLKEPFSENLVHLNEEMKKVYPQDELMFRSLEQEMRRFSESVRVFRDVTLLASVTILFIILMGLIGYVNDEIRLRSKEIAIRKVNGAEGSSILRLLSRDALWLAVPAVAIGTFGAFKAGQLWISQFVDTVHLSVMWYIVVALCLILFILSCVIIKAWRIANENPVHSIKSE